MIFSGIDIVHIPRFKEWGSYTDNQLSSIFSTTEIAEFKRLNEQGSQFLASRFAVKEACYKAMSSAFSSLQQIQPFSLRAIARFIEITHDTRWGCPHVCLDATNFYTATNITLPQMQFSISLSHEHDYAIAHVSLKLL